MSPLLHKERVRLGCALYAAFSALVIAPAGLLALACSGGSPVAPERDCAAETQCSEVAPRPLSADEERAQLELARAEVERELGRAITTPAPRVKYVACPFYVPNSNFGKVCAAGVTRWRDGYIQVSTFQQPRIAPLVFWEARNYFYCHNDACERAI